MTERMTVTELAKYKDEDTIQKEVAAWLDACLPSDWRWFHCPNGGARTKATAGRLKSHGVKPGVFDVIICRPRGPDIWIELKAHGGYLNEAQKSWRDWRNQHGLPTYVCRSVGEVILALKDHMARRAA